MKEYPKIETMWVRRKEKPFTVVEGEFRTPELEFLKDLQWRSFEKINGTNIRVMWNGSEVSFGGKTDNASIPPFLLTKLQSIFLVERFTSIPEWKDTDVCLYGEGYGARIQKGGGNYIPDGVDFILFDVWVGGWWLKMDDVFDVADKLGIKIVPWVMESPLEKASDFAKIGFCSFLGPCAAEGLVLRPAVDLVMRNGQRIITKIKQKDFSKEI